MIILDIIRGYKNTSSLMKIRAARAYVLGVKKTRLFCLGALFVAFSFALLLSGLALVQAALFTYSMWSSEVKFIVALLLGGAEFLGAVGIMAYLFKEETWARFYGIQKVLDSVVENKQQDTGKGGAI